MELELALAAHRAVASMSVTAEWLTLKAAISIPTPLRCICIHLELASIALELDRLLCTIVILASQHVSARILNLFRQFLHLELALSFHHCPYGWSLTLPSRGSQGGGVYVSSNGEANFEGCNIHDNTARRVVCLHLELSLNFHLSPLWRAG